MTNPYTGPTPPTPPSAPAPRPPDTRPLHKRVLVWLGGAGLLIAGSVIGATGDDGQEAVQAATKPGATVTATVTATPEPAPTVTTTVEAKAKPRPTVTVTRTATAKAAGADSGSDGSGGGGGGGEEDPGTGTCSIVSNSGNCYSAGQFCRNSDHGAVTTTEDGTEIKCAYSSNAWRWTYV
ncbi:MULTISPECIES: hypothetical protein [Streptomyces]|uniref:Secreted protein n=1 Tax=Streptomyces griseiscabiei TaxID=2993540 RepID=A0ABU4LEY1_9ACTN|nr:MULTISPECIES: hypothetical protein [Streptomyces]MBZ3907163.1 hypothetical protein [Streptomyces griseiscabiei]MDX2914337.1 hypothetical protein [Streptomyces griseiscabiei]